MHVYTRHGYCSRLTDHHAINETLRIVGPREPGSVAPLAPCVPNAVNTLSAEQTSALAAIKQWLAEPGNKQIFRLFGYAGSGKTTLARHVAEGRRVAFCAFTGKAASVMRRAGCADAATIHSLLYTPEEDERGHIHFAPNLNTALNFADLIVIDECSMVDATLGRDLLGFGKPILVLGDPAQLPPPDKSSQGFFTSAHADILLSEVHRQAKDDPILDLAQRARHGLVLPRGRYGGSCVIGFDDLDALTLVKADQILVGRRDTAARVNARLRTFLGYTDAWPQPGDKLVCGRNIHAEGAFNGTLWRVDAVRHADDDFLKLELHAEDDPKHKIKVVVHAAHFTGSADALSAAHKRRSRVFHYGYALTVHKAQGSQWDHVVLIDEGAAFPDLCANWRYTGITRAVARLTFVN